MFKDAERYSKLKKRAVLIFVVLHCSAIIHGFLSSNVLYPSSPTVASKLEFLRDVERAFNRRESHTWVDNFFNRYAQLVGLSQQWNTFAPIPPRTVTRFLVVAAEPDSTERVVWKSVSDLEGEGTGWIYDPRAKLVGMFEIPFTAFHQQFLRTLAQKIGLRKGTLILKAESSKLMLDEDRKPCREEPHSYDLMKMQW